MNARIAPVLEIGGTHVSAAFVDLDTRRLTAGSLTRRSLRPEGTAQDILGTIVRCARSLHALPGVRWAVATPGPFDYASGVALFQDVGKFEALHGVDVRRTLTGALPAPDSICFLNDADAFLLGEWWAGAARGHDRAVGITLGTGVGSAFLADGAIVDGAPDVPPEGCVNLLTYDGKPLEETVSRRAIRAAYAAARPADPPVDVREIADRARVGDLAAKQVLADALRALGICLAPWLHRFDASVLVVGGSMAASWDLLAEPFYDGLDTLHPRVLARLAVTPARLPDAAPLIGAALWAAEAGQPAPTAGSGP
ncbi:ROK family protein [Kitasatospora sp. NPDC088346]|uniref:ROK family protein n=1 Tax=Kitasatospora sp. NPDC088346 TaxID=3364073 RepID=UPI00382F5016